MSVNPRSKHHGLCINILLRDLALLEVEPVYKAAANLPLVAQIAPELLQGQTWRKAPDNDLVSLDWCLAPGGFGRGGGLGSGLACRHGKYTVRPPGRILGVWHDESGEGKVEVGSSGPGEEIGLKLYRLGGKVGLRGP